MNDDQYLLANAYLDGELTAGERRIAEADPEVMAEVDQLRSLQAELRDVPTPAVEARDAAIAAAMAEFSASAATTEPDPAPVVPLRRRPTSAKVLAVAAALVAVAGLGIVISQADLGGGDDDDAAGVADAPISETVARADDLTDSGDTSAESREAPPESEMMAESAPVEAASDAGVGGADASDEPATEAVAQEGAVEEGDQDAEDVGPSVDAESTSRIEVPLNFDAEAPIVDEVALAVYGSYLLGRIELGVLGPTPETRCRGPYDILDTAIYVLDGDDRPVYVAVNEPDGFVRALDVDTCTVLAEGKLF